MIDHRGEIGTSERKVIDDASPRDGLRMLAQVALAIGRGLRAVLGHVDDIAVAEVEPLDRELEVGGVAAPESKHALVPLAGALDIRRLNEEMLEMTERHGYLARLDDLAPRWAVECVE